MSNMNRPKIVVLGAGYAGMMTAKRLTENLSPDEAEIVLVNKHNYHYQTTWLHEVAAGTINHNQARIMISDVINPNRVRLIYDTVVEVDTHDQRIVLEDSELSYDYVVVSLGFKTNTFGITGMEENAFFIQDIDSSRMIRDHMEYQFAKYNNEAKSVNDNLTIIVGGAGFTGIEFLGELVERIPKLCKKYDVDRSKIRIINVEAAPTIMPGFNEQLIQYGKQSLESRGVEFRLDSKITECKADRIVLNDGEEIVAETIVWTGGVTGNELLEKSGFELTKGKVSVANDLRMPDKENVFVLGDCSWVMNEATDRPYASTAQLAMQEADVAAYNLESLVKNQPLKNFVFDDKGTVASLGGKDAMGTVFNDNLIYGKTATFMKKMIDNRYLLLLGGPKLILKKGKLRPF